MGPNGRGFAPENCCFYVNRQQVTLAGRLHLAIRLTIPYGTKIWRILQGTKLFLTDDSPNYLFFLSGRVYLSGFNHWNDHWNEMHRCYVCITSVHISCNCIAAKREKTFLVFLKLSPYCLRGFSPAIYMIWLQSDPSSFLVTPGQELIIGSHSLVVVIMAFPGWHHGVCIMLCVFYFTVAFLRTTCVVYIRNGFLGNCFVNGSLCFYCWLL